MRRWLAIGRRGLRRRDSGDTRLSAGRTWRGRTHLAQPVFELAVAVLQFLVLAGELAQLLLEPLDAQLRIAVIGLRHGLLGHHERCDQHCNASE